jgi:hypothetical protein
MESMESTWTPHHNYQNRQYWVELHHLRPVLLKKKGDWIGIISGDHQGVVAEVIACKSKSLNAEVVVNRAKIAFNFSDICRLTRPD